MKAILRDSFLLTGTIHGTKYERENRTEDYVEIPPAFVITDSQGGMWSFGTNYRTKRDGHLEFNVIRNDVDLDEYAEKIVYQRGQVRIFGRDGWRVWNGRTFI